TRPGGVGPPGRRGPSRGAGPAAGPPATIVGGAQPARAATLPAGADGHGCGSLEAPRPSDSRRRDVGGTAEFGLTGLAVMGQNLARNIAAHHDIPVAVHNRTATRTRQFMDEHGHEGSFVPAWTGEELVGGLRAHRRSRMVVKAG